MTSETGLELEDPLEEDKDSLGPGLTHRYPDRVLMVTTQVDVRRLSRCIRREQDKMRRVARHDRAKMTMIERQKPKNSKTLRGRDHRRIRKADLQVAILIENLRAANHIRFFERQHIEFFSPKCSNEVARRVSSKTRMKQIVDFRQQHNRNEKVANFGLGGGRRRGMIHIARVIEGEHAAGVADQGHRRPSTASRRISSSL